MNKQRRKELRKIKDKLIDIQTELENIKEQEEEAYENMPDSLKNTEKGQKMEEGISSLDGAYDIINDAISYIEEVTEEG